MKGSEKRVRLSRWLHTFHRVKSTGMFLVLAALVAGSLFGYFSTGWNRMESACTAEPPGAPVARTVEFRWSWAPLGFQCTYDTGHQRTSLWF